MSRALRVGVPLALVLWAGGAVMLLWNPDTSPPALRQPPLRLRSPEPAPERTPRRIDPTANAAPATASTRLAMPELAAFREKGPPPGMLLNGQHSLGQPLLAAPPPLSPTPPLPPPTQPRQEPLAESVASFNPLPLPPPPLPSSPPPPSSVRAPSPPPPSPAAVPDITGATSSDAVANFNVHAFYYAWYGSPSLNATGGETGDWVHWNHEFIQHWDKQVASRWPKGRHDPSKHDVGADFYPSLGPYASSDGAVITQHVKWAKKAGVGVLALSWYPPGKADENGRPSDPLVLPLLDACLAQGLRLAIHLEPYKGRDPASVRRDLEYLAARYGPHAALHRMARTKGGPQLPLVYVYDSYHNSPAEWRKLLGPASGPVSSGSGGGVGEQSLASIRGTPSDCFVVCLYVESHHVAYVRAGGFDGFYTYFAADGFTHGSTTKHWEALRRLARDTGTVFIPSVGPGYVDTSVRPWNAATTRDREGGKYYDKMWEAALAEGGGSVVSVTSFNEWHEGTQIEPAVPARRDGAKYLDYGALGPDGYLEKTARWSAKQRQLHPLPLQFVH